MTGTGTESSAKGMSMPKDVTFIFPCGRLLCGPVRDFLGRVELRRPELRWHESSELLEREFTVVGPKTLIVWVRQTIEAWARVHKVLNEE